MEDNTTSDEEAGVKSPLWARAVTIDGHVVVSGNVAGGVIGAGDYVVWSCGVGMIDVSCLLFSFYGLGFLGFWGFLG